MNNTSIKESFYISMNLQQLVFTQGSVLGELIDRWNIDRKQHQQKINKQQQNKTNHQQNKDQSQLSADISQLLRQKQQQKTVFLIQLFKVTKRGEDHQQKQQQQQLCQSLSIARIDSVQSTNKLYQYPINLTSLEIKAKDQLSSFVYQYSPMVQQQVLLRVSLQLSTQQKDKILIGQCVIDMNLLVEMFLDQGTQCIKDCKRLAKRIDSNKQIDQNVDAIIELFIERDRVSLQRVKINSKKGINVVDFKQQIKRIMREKKLIQAEGNNRDEGILSQSIQPKSQQLGNSQKNEKLNKKSNKSLSLKYHKYLQRNVEQRLKYIHPKKDLIQNEVDTLMKQRQQILMAQQKSKKSLLPQKKVQQNKNKTSQQQNKTLSSPVKQTKNLSTQKSNQNSMQRLKIVIFVIVSSILLYLVMTPSRKDIGQQI